MARRILCLALSLAPLVVACDRSPPARDAGVTPVAPTVLSPVPVSTAVASADARGAELAPLLPLGGSARAMGAPQVLFPDGAPEELNRLKPLLLACYTRALARDPSLEGSVFLTVRIQAAGDVADAGVSADRFGPDAAECFRQATMVTRFTSTGADERSVKVEVRMLRSPRAAGSP